MSARRSLRLLHSLGATVLLVLVVFCGAYAAWGAGTQPAASHRDDGSSPPVAQQAQIAPEHVGRWDAKNFTQVVVVGLAPIGPAEEDYFFGLYWSNQWQRRGERLEPGLPAGCSTSLSLRLLTPKGGSPELRDPTGVVRVFKRDHADQGRFEADGFRLELDHEGTCAARLVDPAGYRWDFDQGGYVRGLTLPDGTRLTVTRAAADRRIVRIDICTQAREESPVRTRDTGDRFWKWPLLCRWPRAAGVRLWLTAGRSLPGAPPLGDVTPATWLQFDWHGKTCTIFDDVGRCWYIAPDQKDTITLQGTTVYPQQVELASVTVDRFEQWICSLPSWIFLAPADAFARAAQRSTHVRVPERTTSPLSPPAQSLANCPAESRECGNTLWLPETGHRTVWWRVDGILWDDCYMGFLSWQKRYHYRFSLSCTPGNTRTRRITWTRSVETELASELGLDDVGSVRTGITQNVTQEVADEFSLSCCRFIDENNRQRQSCEERWFQALYDHTLYYARRPCNSGGVPYPFTRVDATWLSDGMNSLLCCDRCCEAQTATEGD